MDEREEAWALFPVRGTRPSRSLWLYDPNRRGGGGNYLLLLFHSTNNSNLSASTSTFTLSIIYINSFYLFLKAINFPLITSTLESLRIRPSCSYTWMVTWKVIPMNEICLRVFYFVWRDFFSLGPQVRLKFEFQPFCVSMKKLLDFLETREIQWSSLFLEYRLLTTRLTKLVTVDCFFSCL